MAYIWIMRPSKVGDYSHLPPEVPSARMKRADRVILDVSKQLGVDPPLRGIIDGDDGSDPDHRIDKGTSVMRWDQGDVLFCLRLFLYAPEELQDEVVAHELVHVKQEKMGKMDTLTDNIVLTSAIHDKIRETEAQRGGLGYVLTGKIAPPPRIASPIAPIAVARLERQFKQRYGINAKGESAFSITGLSCAVLAGVVDEEERRPWKLRGSL